MDPYLCDKLVWVAAKYVDGAAAPLPQIAVVHGIVVGVAVRPAQDSVRGDRVERVPGLGHDHRLEVRICGSEVVGGRLVGCGLDGLVGVTDDGDGWFVAVDQGQVLVKVGSRKSLSRNKTGGLAFGTSAFW